MFTRQKRVLAGEKILLTCALEQASKIKEKLEKFGAEVFNLPTIRIVPPKSYRHLDEAIGEIENYQWIIFTSQNAVDFFFQRYRKKKRPWEILRKIKIGAIGPATRKKIKKYHLEVAFEPKKYTSRELVKNFKSKNLEMRGTKILLPRADIAPEWLPQKLKKFGAQVTRVVAYRTIRERKVPFRIKKMLRTGEIDFVIFTSSSTVKNFFSLIPKEYLHPKIKFVSIGPVTTETAKELGLKIKIQAKEHTTDGLVKAILRNADDHRRRPE